MDKRNFINFENYEEFSKRYEKIYNLLPFTNYRLEEIEDLFKKMDNFTYSFKEFLKILSWEKNLLYIVYNIIKKYIGILYESKKDVKEKTYMKENKEIFYRNFFKILIIFTKDDVSEIFIKFKLLILEEFFSYFICNFNIIDLLNDTINYLYFITTFLQEFYGLIFHFYLNLQNLLSIEKLSDLLSINKIIGEYGLIYSNFDYLAIFDCNIRNSFKCLDKTIILNNRETFFNNIIMFVAGIPNVIEYKKLIRKNSISIIKFDENNYNNNVNSVKINKMTFKQVSNESLINNIKEYKEFFSPFLITYFLIYGKSYFQKNN